MREIPKRNYLILFLILGFTVALVFYIRGWYVATKEYYSMNSVIKDVAYEINENELYSYTVENPNFILYASSGTNGDIKDFEGRLKSLIIKNDLSNEFVYLNLDNVDINSFNNSLKSKFFSGRMAGNFNDLSISTFYVFRDGKIAFIYNGVNDYSMKYLDGLFKRWGSND